MWWIRQISSLLCSRDQAALRVCAVCLSVCSGFPSNNQTRTTRGQCWNASLRQWYRFNGWNKFSQHWGPRLLLDHISDLESHYQNKELRYSFRDLRNSSDRSPCSPFNPRLPKKQRADVTSRLVASRSLYLAFHFTPKSTLCCLRVEMVNIFGQVFCCIWICNYSVLHCL